MIDKMLSAIGILLSVFGTVLTLWTTFTTSTKYVGTCDEYVNRPLKFPKEKRRVIIGVILIITGGILQVVGLFWQNLWG